MSTILPWQEIILRLVSATVAGVLIGLNRGEHGQAAGLRTTLLVCLAACVAMIQMNLLLGMTGKHPDSFAVMDLMRLPLGILSGMGFIGAGAILHRENLVVGVTTAATLWFVTVMGLCFGGGQVVLGFVALGLCLFILWALKWVEMRWVGLHGTLTLGVVSGGPTLEDVEREIRAGGCDVGAWSSITSANKGRHREIVCYVRWRGNAVRTPPFYKVLESHPGVERIDWKV